MTPSSAACWRPIAPCNEVMMLVLNPDPRKQASQRRFSCAAILVGQEDSCRAGNFLFCKSRSGHLFVRQKKYKFMKLLNKIKLLKNC